MLLAFLPLCVMPGHSQLYSCVLLLFTVLHVLPSHAYQIGISLQWYCRTKVTVDHIVYSYCM